MTAAHATPDAGDLIRDFRRHLPPGLFAELNDTQRVVALVYRLVTEDGWTPQQLAKRASRGLGNAVNPGGLLTHRLEQLVGQSPDEHGKPVTRPFCSDECRANGGWIVDQHGAPISKCPCRTTDARGGPLDA